jgi:hypothetical protein
LTVTARPFVKWMNMVLGCPATTAPENARCRVAPLVLLLQRQRHLAAQRSREAVSFPNERVVCIVGSAVRSRECSVAEFHMLGTWSRADVRPTSAIVRRGRDRRPKGRLRRDNGTRWLSAIRSREIHVSLISAATGTIEVRVGNDIPQFYLRTIWGCVERLIEREVPEC